MFSISSDGVISKSLVIEEEGMRVFVTKMFALHDGSCDILALVTCQQVAVGPSALMILGLDSSMNIVQRHFVPFSFEEKPIKDIKLMNNENGDILAAVTFGQQPPFEIFLLRISIDGEIINHTQCDMDSLVTVCNLFLMRGETDRFGMFARTSGSSNAMMGVLVFDEDLQLVSRSYFPQWDCGENFMYLDDYGNSSILPLPDSSYVLSSRIIESSTMQHDQSSMFARIDGGFTLRNYTVIGHLNDTVEYPAFYRSVDYFAHPDNHLSVYQCTMQNIIQGWPLQSAPMHLVITKADADLNIEWRKRFLIDGKAYTPFTMVATSDGGCLIIGQVFDYDNEYQWNVFALKINADGFVGLDEIKEESQAFVYPNPAKETLKIGGVEAKETQVFNTLGHCVMNFRGNEAIVEALAFGVYLLKVTDSEGMKHTIRMVKE